MERREKILKKWRALAAIFFLAAFASNMQAQNVTISPKTGHLMAALTYDGEVGFQNGLSAMWRHEQLALTFTVADDTQLTDGGEIANPAGNISEYNGNLAIMGGANPDLYCVLSLPKGYRITGYRLVLLNNLKGYTVNNMAISNNVSNSFYETGSDYSVSNYKAIARSATGSTTIGTRNNTEYVIERTSMTEDDMGNQLYFHMTKTNNAYYGVTIKSFEVYFTAEGTFEAEVTPEEVGVARSLVMSPFKTSKVDIGLVQSETKNGHTYFAYNYKNVRDLDAYTYLYQEDAVQDGVPTDVAADKHIYPVKVDGKNLYAFGNGTYYVETPTEVYTQTGLVAPIGYRIVGALFNYLWGSAVAGGPQVQTNYYITYTSGGTTYYLNDQLHFTTSKFAWNRDADGNIYTGNRYLACTGSGGTRTLSFSTDANGDWNLRVNGSGYLYWTRWLYGTLYLQGTTNSSITPSLRNTTSNRAQWTSVQETITVPGFSPGAYKLNVYDKTGKNIQQTIEVNSASDAGKVYDMGVCNNDAVKFSITGLEEGKQALVSVTLIMQALNPYIDKMDIVCHDNADQLSLTQSFTADDFSVSGGVFKFYVPDEYKNEDLTFTFSDLYSKYGDETYYDGAGLGAARYSFVNSDYFTPINGNGNGGLYDSSYNPDADYKTKIYTSVAGDKAFKFNNAEDLGNTGSGQSYLEEYPFSVTEYLSSTGTNGKFVDVVLNASKTHSGTYYVFTADETRYNIAPSYAWQHRYYAFYTMAIDLEAKTYSPDFTWTKIYNETAYSKDGEASDAMWGLKLGTVDSETSEGMEGYLTTKEIDDAITAALGQENCPASADQILYVDGSELYSVINSSALTLEDLKAKLAPNALFYLPANTTSTLDNFAYKTSSGSFRAGKDIVLKDKKPFYAPYDIQVDAANYAQYTREITWASAGKNTLQTVLLPFTLSVSGGTHTEEDGTAFTLNQMAASNCLSLDAAEDANAENFKSKAHFTPISGEVSEANVPYMVEVTNAPSDANTPFIAKQKGATVKATTGMESDYHFKGESATGTINGANYSFQNLASYSGKTLTAADGYFYFARGMYLNSKNIRPEVSKTLIVYPFRAYFSYSGGSAKQMGFMDVVFGENETSGIGSLESESAVAVDANAPVYDMQGRMIAPTMGSLAGKTLPRGIYVVNGVKIIVK